MYINYLDNYLRIGVESDEAFIFDFIKQYFIPYFSFTENVETGGELIGTVKINTNSYVNFPEFNLNSKISIDRSKGFLNLNGYVYEDEGTDIRWIKMEQYECILKIEKSINNITLYANSGSDIRIPLLRVIEDIFSNNLQKQNRFLFHASAITIDNEAILFLGNKGAGKTTILSKCLSNFYCNKMANDNVVIWFQDGKIKARGWPTFFKAQIGTLATTFELADEFPNREDAIAALTNDSLLWSFYEKVPLYPVEAARKFNTEITPEAYVSTIIFPQFSTNIPPGLKKVPFINVKEGLHQFLQGIKNPNHSDWMALNSISLDAFSCGYNAFLTSFETISSIDYYVLTWAPSVVDILCNVGPLRYVNKSISKAAKCKENWQKL